jgi:acetoacetyl-CoA synthetase
VSAILRATSHLTYVSSEIQAKTLGLKVEVFDPFGKNIEHTGEPGELVCTRPHPSLPLYFWNDPTGEKLRDVDTFPGVWRQGDFIVVNPATKGILILGRSDGVLNPSGVRFGSGEVYAVMDQFKREIDDNLCVGQRRQHDKDETVLLFLKMRPGHPFTPDLENRIRIAVKTALSARHVPKYIFETEDIPVSGVIPDLNGERIDNDPSVYREWQES